MKRGGRKGGREGGRKQETHKGGREGGREGGEDVPVDRIKVSCFLDHHLSPFLETTT